MLSELPSEIISHITIFLPSASALTHLSLTCRRVYKIIKAQESSLFRAFVQSQFPTIETPPFWKDAACALTSRSRALDRLGVVGRFVVSPEATTNIGFHGETRRDNPTLGYRPPIDSYEIWNGSSWADKKEVLTWGAGHRLVMRIKQSGGLPKESWIVFNDIDHVSSYDDICGVHLLEPEYGSKSADIENSIFARVRGDIVRLALSPGDANYAYKQRFLTGGLELTATDLSDGTHPLLLAHFDNESLALYSTNVDGEEVEPLAWIRDDTMSLGRSRYAKLLSSSRIAVATKENETSFVISTISPHGVSPIREFDVNFLDTEGPDDRPPFANASSIAPLNAHGLAGAPGEVFLTAWGDRVVRLHDARSPFSYETTYRDPIDDHLIYCLQPFAQDRFLVGSGGDALVKIFDLRMDKPYSYVDAQLQNQNAHNLNGTNKGRSRRPRKDFSLFLSAKPSPSVFRGNNHRRRRPGAYRGPIYTMSTPSPSSPTVYTGIVDGVLRLDFASTDDLTGPAKEWYSRNLDLGINIGKSDPREPAGEDVMNLAGYERPDPDDLTTTSKLRTQHKWFWSSSGENGQCGTVDTGWDRRWEDLEEPGAWRRRDG